MSLADSQPSCTLGSHHGLRLTSLVVAALFGGFDFRPSQSRFIRKYTRSKCTQRMGTESTSLVHIGLKQPA